MILRKTFNFTKLKLVKFQSKFHFEVDNKEEFGAHSVEDKEYVKKYEAYVKRMQEEQFRQTFDKKRKFEDELRNGKRAFLNKLKFNEVPDSNEKVNVDAMANGFFLLNGVWAPGPVLLFPTRYYLWGIYDAHDIKPHTLDILKVIKPKPNYFIIGTGKYMVEYEETLYEYFMDVLKMKLEIMPTFEAVTQFNLSVEDDINVAAAIIPPNL